MLDERKKIMREKAIRERVFPKIWDASFLLTNSNIKVFLHLLNLLNKELKVRILDIGCGYKPYMTLFEKESFDFEYIGVDFNENSEADFILDMNKDKLPFSDSSFDIVILSEVLEHLYNPLNAIKEAVRVLRKTGYIYISTPFVYHYHDIPYDFYRYTEFFYKRVAEDFSLEIIKSKKGCSFFTIPFFTLNLLLSTVFSKLKAKIFVYPITTLFNISALCIDSFMLKIAEKAGLKEKLQHMNCGIAIIFKKNV